MSKLFGQIKNAKKYVSSDKKGFIHMFEGYRIFVILKPSVFCLYAH